MKIIEITFLISCLYGFITAIIDGIKYGFNSYMNNKQNKYFKYLIFTSLIPFVNIYFAIKFLYSIIYEN